MTTMSNSAKIYLTGGCSYFEHPRKLIRCVPLQRGFSPTTVSTTGGSIGYIVL